MTCPLCKECPFSKGVCEQRITRGRRFFLMGALALPVARKIERIAQLVVPKYEAPKLTRLHDVDIKFHMSMIKIKLRDGTEALYSYPSEVDDTAFTLKSEWSFG